MALNFTLTRFTCLKTSNAGLINVRLRRQKANILFCHASKIFNKSLDLKLKIDQIQVSFIELYFSVVVAERHLPTST